MIHLQYFGQSFWKVWNEEIAIAIDPFHDLGFPLPKNVEADVVLSSHDHFDHNNLELIKNTSLIIKTPGDFTYQNILFEAFSTFHDELQGAKRGKNLIFKFTMEKHVIIHCGDLGVVPSPEIIKQIMHPDILFIPVGGFYTIDADKAYEIVQLLRPTLVFPMHYKTNLVDSKIAPVTSYLTKVDNIIEIQDNKLDLTEDIFQSPKTIILQF